MKKILATAVLAATVFAGGVSMATPASAAPWYCASNAEKGVVAKELTKRLIAKGFSRKVSEMQAVVTVAKACRKR